MNTQNTYLVFPQRNDVNTQASPVAIDEERYKVIDVESYETRVYTVEDRVSGEQFSVWKAMRLKSITHSDSYMDPFPPEWHIVDEDSNEIIENNDLFDTLINTVLESK